MGASSVQQHGGSIPGDLPRIRRPRLLLAILALSFGSFAPVASAMPAASAAQSASATATAPPAQGAVGLLHSVSNATVVAAGDDLRITRKDSAAPIELLFSASNAIGLSREEDQWWILPALVKAPPITPNHALWVLPLAAKSSDCSWRLDLPQGTVAEATLTEAGLRVLLRSEAVVLHPSEARPHSDLFGNRFALTFAGGPSLADALASFYWGTMLPSVVERTMAAHFPYSSGYVLSTLKISSYAGSYPAVDHEFQIKGRLAIGSEADLDLVRRMIELQFRLMNDDPERLSRAPTSVQPDGRREYHIRRNSMDKRQNAAMFPYTANIEVLEEAWQYVEARKDLAWLRANIGNLERAAAWTEAGIDQYGRLWSDVFYEDQVIKDGRVTQAQAFAAHAFSDLARMERLLGRQQQAATDTALAAKLAAALIQPLPVGYWDEPNHRFVDWVDRDGVVHDHIHLLANALPVTFGYATPAQAAAVKTLIDANAAQFERFPSFLAVDIAKYTPSEIGDGGPYDLSAAGRYWFWDAAFRQARKENQLLVDQLTTVAAEAAKHNGFMGERYDMDHVFYIDGNNAHGAEQYYEYPNVFAAVLISDLLGLSIPIDADLSVAPHLTSFGSVDFAIPEYAVRYTWNPDGFVLQNLSSKRRRIRVDLSGLGAGSTHLRLTSQPSSIASGTSSVVTLAPHAEARWATTP